MRGPFEGKMIFQDALCQVPRYLGGVMPFSSQARGGSGSAWVLRSGWSGGSRHDRICAVANVALGACRSGSAGAGGFRAISLHEAGCLHHFQPGLLSSGSGFEGKHSSINLPLAVGFQPPDMASSQSPQVMEVEDQWLEPVGGLALWSLGAPALHTATAWLYGSGAQEGGEGGAKAAGRVLGPGRFSFQNVGGLLRCSSSQGW